jgi:hypothetical protein
VDADNEVQPDVLVRRHPSSAAGASILRTTTWGAARARIEVAASSASYDLHDKLKAYRRNGVREYLVWLVEESRFACYRQREEGELEPVDTTSSAGIFRSAVFGGLWLSTRALLAGDSGAP